MDYQTDFQEVLEFYQKSSPTQHQMFLDIISDKLTLFCAKTSTSYDVDPEYRITFNGIYHQINIK